MIEIQCETCGSLFRLPDSMAGRRARCAKCRTPLTVPLLEVEPEPINPEALAEKPIILNLASATDAKHAPPNRPGMLNPTAMPRRSFLADVGCSFVVPFKGAGLSTLLTIALLGGFVNSLAGLITLYGLAPCLGIFFLLTVVPTGGGYLADHCFEIVQGAAVGEEQITSIQYLGFVDSMLVPTLKFLLAIFWSYGPLVLWMVLNHMSSAPPVWPRDAIITAFAWCQGGFAFPVVLLSISINDASLSALRPDLLIRTACRQFPHYLAVWMIAGLLGVFMFGLMVLQWLTAAYGMAGGWGPLALWSALGLLLSCVNAYLLIVIMRTIGLFYWHGQREFAWNAR